MRKICVAACLTLALAGCDQFDHLVGKSSGPPKSANPTPAQTSPTWSYDENPTAALATDAPVRGEANGKPLALDGAYFEPGMRSWELHLTQNALANPTAFANPGEQFIVIDLPEQPSSGQSFTRPLKYGDGFFQITDPKNAGHVTSWNAPNAYYLEITSWDAKSYDPNGPMSQLVGKASGKLYIAYQGGSSGFQNSGVAGSFKDAPIRYMSKPPAWMTAGTVPVAQPAGAMATTPTGMHSASAPPPMQHPASQGTHAAPPAAHANHAGPPGKATASSTTAHAGPPGKGAPGKGGAAHPPPPPKRH